MSTLFGVSTDYLLKDVTTEEKEPIRDFVREDEEQEREEVEEEASTKKTKGIREFVDDIFWMAVLIVYLLVSFITHRWDITWIIWLVAGIFDTVIEFCFKRRKK